VKKQPFKVVIKDGNIVSVYSELLDLTRLRGIPEIHRATEVKFDNDLLCWSILSLPPIFQKEEVLATGFKLRSEAISWEVNFLNTNMEKILNESKTLNSAG